MVSKTQTRVASANTYKRGKNNVDMLSASYSNMGGDTITVGKTHKPATPVNGQNPNTYASRQNKTHRGNSWKVGASLGHNGGFMSANAGSAKGLS